MTHPDTTSFARGIPDAVISTRSHVSAIHGAVFFTTRGFGPDAIRDATLVDTDLVRGNGDTETVSQTGSDFEIFVGFPSLVSPGGGQPNFFIQRDGEARVDVTFSDGTTLNTVFALREFASFSFGTNVDQYLLDATELAAAGQTVADVIAVEFRSHVDHDLSWADLGFTATGVVMPDPEPQPGPEPEPALTLIAGTARADRLRG